MASCDDLDLSSVVFGKLIKPSPVHIIYDDIRNEVEVINT